ncbi:integrase arm-type DNA-binding domain-containing protein [Burkholderia multivorans]|uniref:tyrosine-type recombinase/integrase n=1 Tax=Burkholderia multivorans TaxID=87883 RepID=UPI002019E73E|nr:integrase arm-type DNA-binding domain-containing protein [Burkholderia multivorans]MCO1371125.1 integrase arm-type DNA-binding domain-containing protein [Burkholderia multivorans]MCO1457617.1 integrase arm-type DNA-binding domain-containing protein [Burkholderia multivorans]MCO1466611.1 integrase arm-type DNA-binding domain-containing protein [Burkholderia multivorans]UQO15720.1 integrase arm-type DNA-binding domain-containing protein [Burkholderia multivorans]UQO86919.1 integrase arm-type 
MTLTALQVQAAKPRSKPYGLPDGNGLFLWVTTDARKYWHFRFRFEGKQPRISLGCYPELSLQQARLAASECQALIAQRIDPRTERRNQKRPDVDDLFSTSAERWLQSKRDSGKASSTVDKFRTYLDKDILPVLGHKRMSDITRADCTRVQERIEARNALNVSKKVRGWLREIFSQAIARGLCEFNPASELKVIAKAAPRSKAYPHLLEPELPDFLNALDQPNSRSIALTAARMTLWTASRPGMVRFAEWTEFDLDTGWWTLPATKMKMGRPHLVPLPTQLIAELRELKKLTGRHRYLYPGSGWKNETISENTINRLFGRIGYKGRLVGHGTRHTASTLLREHGWDKDHVESQLSHKEGGVAGDYNQAQYAPQRAAMMQWYADYLDALKAGLTAEQRENFARRVNVYKRHHVLICVIRRHRFN